MTDFSSPEIDFTKSSDGLVPAVVQHADTGAVLMLGYFNAEALALTRQTGRVTFWSRGRQRLWAKGETSGHGLRLVSLHADCDRDTVLVRARPTGPVCHRLTPTCFDDVPAAPFLPELAALLAARRSADPATSYTASLLAAPAKAAQKVGEEATEVVIEAISGNRERLREEAADLLYHLLVLLTAHDVPLAAVEAVLRGRMAGRP